MVQTKPSPPISETLHNLTTPQLTLVMSQCPHCFGTWPNQHSLSSKVDKCCVKIHVLMLRSRTFITPRPTQHQFKWLLTRNGLPSCYLIICTLQAPTTGAPSLLTPYQCVCGFLKHVAPQLPPSCLTLMGALQTTVLTMTVITTQNPFRIVMARYTTTQCRQLTTMRWRSCAETKTTHTPACIRSSEHLIPASPIQLLPLTLTSTSWTFPGPT